jgi:hypothetical protein
MDRDRDIGKDMDRDIGTDMDMDLGTDMDRDRDIGKDMDRDIGTDMDMDLGTDMEMVIQSMKQLHMPSRYYIFKRRSKAITSKCQVLDDHPTQLLLISKSSDHPTMSDDHIIIRKITLAELCPPLGVTVVFRRVAAGGTSPRRPESQILRRPSIR